jgi:hypothetical protein
MKNILITTVIILLIAAAWIGGCSRGGYKQGLKDGKLIERLKLDKTWDSINFAETQKKMDAFELTNNALQSEIKTYQVAIVETKVSYDKKIKTLLKLSGKEIDSVYRLYADDSLQAVQNFVNLDECKQVSRLQELEINTLNKKDTNSQKIIQDLYDSIEKDKNETIELRDQVTQLTTDLTSTQEKMKRRTNQRNLTWCGLVVLIVGAVILN